MDKAEENAMKKASFEIMFHDSPEYFCISNAKMIQEKNLIRFICFDEFSNLKEDVWFPISDIYRIKRYAFQKL